MKKLLALAVIAGGVLFVVKRNKAAKAEADLWREATAPVPSNNGTTRPSRRARPTTDFPRAVRARTRGCSSIGRAPPLQGGGQGFDSPQLHNDPRWRPTSKRDAVFRRPQLQEADHRVPARVAALAVLDRVGLARHDHQLSSRRTPASSRAHSSGVDRSRSPLSSSTGTFGSSDAGFEPRRSDRPGQAALDEALLRRDFRRVRPGRRGRQRARGQRKQRLPRADRRRGRAPRETLVRAERRRVEAGAEGCRVDAARTCSP